MKTRYLISAAAVALLVASGMAIAQTPPATRVPNPPMSTLSPAEQAFVMAAARGSEREVEMGELAKDKGQSIPVREFGARMVTDHGQAVRELRQLAASKGVHLSNTKTGREEPSMERLTKLSRPEFDREYANTMLKDHEKDVAEFRRMAQQARDPDLKAWVQKTLPTIEGHLQTIKAIQGTVQGAVR
jgi:putative membrane protein